LFEDHGRVGHVKSEGSLKRAVISPAFFDSLQKGSGNYLHGKYLHILFLKTPDRCEILTARSKGVKSRKTEMLLHISASYSKSQPLQVGESYKESRSASVVSHTIVTDPTIRQPGFDLPRHTWSLVNRFRTGQGPCRAVLHKWGLAQSHSCDCGQRQTTNHIVDTCPLTKSEGGLNLLHEAGDERSHMAGMYTATAALAKL